MTACSNHPGTIKGAELQKLVSASEQLHEELKDHIGVAAARCGIDYPAFQLLRRLVHDEGHSEERGLGLLRAAKLVSGEVPHVVVTAAGTDAYITICRARDDWLDRVATKLDVEALRATTELLRQIRLD
jgi:hypothetical protein